MEEKERYMITYEDDGLAYLFDKKNLKYIISDGSINDEEGVSLCNLLNQQDKRIKELEQENLSLQEQSIRDNQNWIEETTQLKQQLGEKEKNHTRFNKSQRVFRKKLQLSNVIGHSKRKYFT